MEDEGKKWERIIFEEKIRENLGRLRIISSNFAADLISEEELQTIIQEDISELCLVAVITDLVYQGEIPIIYEDCQEERSQKEFIREIKKINKADLIQVIVKVFKDRKKNHWEQKKQKQKIKKIQYIEAKQMSLLFFV